MDWSKIISYILSGLFLLCVLGILVGMIIDLIGTSCGFVGELACYFKERKAKKVKAEASASVNYTEQQLYGCGPFRTLYVTQGRLEPSGQPKPSLRRVV